MKGIEVKNITKKYKETLALDNVSFHLESGKIYGLLGRNGAGKSTLINILSNRIFASEGIVLIDGDDCCNNEKIHEKIFCMSEADLYPNLKVRELLYWTHQFYDSFDLKKAYTIAELFQLNIDKKMNALSTGYKSIFKLVVALSLDVPYIVYDEPVLGLDANHRELFYKLLLEDYQENLKTIIIATHLIEEIAHLIEEVVIIDQGKILLQDTVENLMLKGYAVSGFQKDVQSYCAGKNVIGTDELGTMSIAYVLGDINENSNEHLQISKMNLQKIFIKITEKGGNMYETKNNN